MDKNAEKSLEMDVKMDTYIYRMITASMCVTMFFSLKLKAISLWSSV